MRILRRNKYVIEYTKFWTRTEALKVLSFGELDKVIKKTTVLILLSKKSMKWKTISILSFKIMRVQPMVLILRNNN